MSFFQVSSLLVVMALTTHVDAQGDGRDTETSS